MKPKPLVALNHFTVPLAITSSPRDQKRKRTAGPRKPPCPKFPRYALWGTLDSLNDSLIPAENDHYRGAFAVFDRSAVNWRTEPVQNATGQRSVGQANSGPAQG